MTKLDYSRKKVLEVVTFDGETLKLEVKRLPLFESKRVREETLALKTKMDRDEISPEEFLIGAMGYRIENFDAEKMQKFEINELTEILNEINIMSEKSGRTEEEKKTV